jgi:hypothetical protein
MNYKKLSDEMIYLLIIVLVLSVAVWTDHAQDKPAAPAAQTPKKYEPTEVESLRLQLKQRDAQLAQVAVQQANAVFQKTVADFNAEVDAIKKAHGWPAEVQIDQTRLASNEIKFVLPPAQKVVPTGPAVPMDKPTGPPVEPAGKP